MKAEDYSQGDAFQAEKRTIFSTQWLPVCAEGQLARPGNFQALTVGGWSVIAARDAAGAVRVLRNACRHQNMPVVSAPSGQCETFRCRFHGWTYDLAGHFLSAPPPVAPPSSQPERNLAALATVCSAGLVYFRIDPPAGRPAPLDNVGPYGGTQATEIACNWKVCVEHLLAEGREYQGPLLAVRRAPSTVIIEQVVPHTFLRTRLLTHTFGPGVAELGVAQVSASIKEACERLQAERAAGVMPRESEFHRLLAAAAE